MAPTTATRETHTATLARILHVQQTLLLYATEAGENFAGIFHIARPSFFAA